MTAILRPGPITLLRTRAAAAMGVPRVQGVTVTGSEKAGSAVG